MQPPFPRTQVTLFDDCCCCFSFCYVCLSLFIHLYFFPFVFRFCIHIFLSVAAYATSLTAPSLTGIPEAPTQMAPKAGRNGTHGPGGDGVGGSDSPVSR